MNSTALTLGIDIGGTQIKIVLIEPDGTLVSSRQIFTIDDVDILVSTVSKIIGDCPHELGAIGISAPGIAANDGRSIAWMRGRLEALEGLQWHQIIEQDIWVLNDAHAATLAEGWIGAAAGKQHALVLTLGTGVGGGVIIDGKLYQGTSGRAGHFGHITLNMNGSHDIVGMPGSLEDAIGNHNVLLRSDGRFSSTQELLNRVAAGDSAARECWQASVNSLAVGIASIVNSFDPAIVVLGGGIAECGAILFDTLETSLKNCEWRPFGTSVPIVPASLGQWAGAIGAARHAFIKSEELQTR